MKKAVGVEDLASRLTEAANAPLMPVALAVTKPAPSTPVPATKSKRPGKISVFLRIPEDIYSDLEEEAIARTRAAGRGVSVAQIILEVLASRALERQGAQS